MLFRYRAIDPHGRIAQGTLDALNPVDLEVRLGKLGLEMVSAKSADEGFSLLPGKSIGRRELITFCFHMEQLTRAGVPILEGLVDLRDSLDHLRFREVIANVIEDIEGGQQLSQALSAHPKIFDPIFVNLLRAGESSGQLPEVLKNLVDTLKWQDELAAQTKKIILYPAFVGTVIMGVVFFLMIYLVPQLVKFIQNMQQTLPWNTKVLIWISDIFVNYWYLILLTPVYVLLGLYAWKKLDPAYQYRLDQYKLKIPVIGPVLKKIILSRFANYFALMYGAGISILDCIRILQGVVGNMVVAEALGDVTNEISEGQGVSASFERTRLFPALVIRMLRVGENTGGLDTALFNVSYFYNRDVKESIDRVQSLIEPVMTVVLGLLLGFVMLSVLGPIYDLISKIK